LKPLRVGYFCIIPTLWLKKPVITGYFASIIKNADNLYITFHSEYPSWVITTFASLGEKAEIISPNSLRTEVKDFLKNALKQYEI